MKSITKPTLTRSAPVSVAPVLRNIPPPSVFVDVDRLHEAVRELIRTRTTMIEACDQADAAAYVAGTPVRTQSFRAHIEAVTTEIQRIESKIAEAAAGEQTGRQSIAGNVTKTLAQQSTDTLGIAKLQSADERKDLRIIDSPNRAANLESEQAIDDDSPFDPSQFSTFGLSKKAHRVPPIEGLVISTKADQPSLSLGGLLRTVRSLLLDGGWGTDRLTNGQLKELARLFGAADATSLTACIASLTDHELKLIASDMDSKGFGNYNGLSGKAKEAFIANLVMKLEPAQFIRCCNAFDDPEQIARVLSQHVTASPTIKLSFLWYLEKLSPSIERSKAAAQMFSTLKPMILQEFALQHLVQLNLGTLSSTGFSAGFEDLYRSALLAGTEHPDVLPVRLSLLLQLETVKNAFGVVDQRVRAVLASILQTTTVHLADRSIFPSSERSRLVSLTGALTNESLADLIDLFPNGPADPNQVNPNLLYGSDAPDAQGVRTFAGAASHGNGYLASNVVWKNATIPGIKSETKIKFTTPGTFTYMCQIHFNMIGTINVHPVAP